MIIYLLVESGLSYRDISKRLDVILPNKMSIHREYHKAVDKLMLMGIL